MYLHAPKNKIRAEYLYAYLSLDEDGTEGICSMVTPGLGTFPLVFMHLERAEELRGEVENLSKQSGKKIHMVKFKREE